MEEGKKEPLEMWAIGTWGGGHWVLSQLKAGGSVVSWSQI